MNKTIADITAAQVRGELINLLERLLPECVDVQNMQNGKLSAIGLNSLTYVELLVLLEEKYGFQFEDEMLSIEKLDEIDLIVEYILAKQLHPMKHRV